MTEEARFSETYELLKTASERTRSALYIFLVVNFALFITVYGVDIADRPKERLDDFLKAVACQNKVDYQEDLAYPCTAALNRYPIEKYRRFLSELSGKPMTSTSAPIVPVKIEIEKKIVEEMVKRQIDTLTVQIPFVGFSFDIDYLWLFTSFFGPLGMIIILFSLRSEREILDTAESFVTSAAVDRDYRLGKLISTQVLLGKKSSDYTYLEKLIFIEKVWFFRFTYMLPILTQIISFFYDAGIKDAIACGVSKILACPGLYTDIVVEFRRHHILQSAMLTLEILSLLGMIFLAWQFIQTTNAIRSKFFILTIGQAK